MSVSNAWKIYQIYTFKWPQFYSSYWSLIEPLTTIQHRMLNDVLWCQSYNHPRQHLIQRQKTNCFLFISYKLSVLHDINLESASTHSVGARCQSSSCLIHTAYHHIHTVQQPLSLSDKQKPRWCCVMIAWFSSFRTGTDSKGSYNISDKWWNSYPSQVSFFSVFTIKSAKWNVSFILNNWTR